MKTDNELDLIKSLIDNTYNRFGNQLLVNTDKPFNPSSPELGYCYKYTNEERHISIYKIICSQTGHAAADKRVLMHEYGHIYLLHLDGIHEELDNKIFNIIKDDRDALIEQINSECGIDFADKLLTRIIDDPVLNHSLHNIAMDMEVNSKILDLEDIEIMEKGVTSVLPKYQEEYLKYLGDQCEDPEMKKKIDDALKKMENESKIKFMHPSRYHHPDKTPFADGLTYAEYLILIIKNLPEFIKMLVSIKMGGNGDTSDITREQIQDALSQAANGGQGNGEGGDPSQGQGGNGGKMDYSQGLDNLLEEMGMSDGDSSNKDGQDKKDGQEGKDGQSSSGDQEDGKSQTPQEYFNKGIREGGAADDLGKELEGDGKTPGGTHKDHGNNERDKADRKRELGEINGQGGTGCGNSGGPGATRKVDSMADEVDMALDEVFQNYSSKIIDINTKKDMMYLWNRGINRSVISPSYRRKYTVKTNPTITFLIDISGSMDTALVDRILKTISNKMRRVGRGLKYNIITWSTRLGEHIKNIDPRKPVPRISYGGGTEMAGGMRYFKDNYGTDSVLILISDFEDYLEEWHRVEETMQGYTIYGFNYGRPQTVNWQWKNFKVREFKQHRNRYGY